MKKIITSVKATELADTTHRFVELFKKTTSLQNDTFLSKTFTEAEQQANALTSAVKKDIAFSKLEEADNERDNTIRVLDRLLKGYEYIPVENLRNHAQKLITIFKKYGVKITAENYSSKSNLIMSMIDDFSAENLKNSIEELVGIKEALTEIKAKQTAFAQIRETYEEALAIQKEKASATSLRKPLLDLMNRKMIPYLVAMNIAQPELFKEFIGKVSEIVNSTNEAVKARGKKFVKPNNMEK